jgi:hypothetical protein
MTEIGAIEPKVCEICGKVFTPKTRRSQKFCSVECRAERKRQLGKEYWCAFGKYKKRKHGKKPLEEDFAEAKLKKVYPKWSMKPWSEMSGEELLHYGQIQTSMNSVRLERGDLNGE